MLFNKLHIFILVSVSRFNINADISSISLCWYCCLIRIIQKKKDFFFIIQTISKKGEQNFFQQSPYRPTFICKRLLYHKIFNCVFCFENWPAQNLEKIFSISFSVHHTHVSLKVSVRFLNFSLQGPNWQFFIAEYLPVVFLLILTIKFEILKVKSMKNALIDDVQKN